MTINIPAAIRVIESDPSWTLAQRTALTRILNELVRPTVDHEGEKTDGNAESDFFFPQKTPSHVEPEPEMIPATDLRKKIARYEKYLLFIRDNYKTRSHVAGAFVTASVVAKEALGELNKTPGHCPKCGHPGSDVARINGNIGYICSERDGGCGHSWDEPPVREIVGTDAEVAKAVADIIVEKGPEELRDQVTFKEGE